MSKKKKKPKQGPYFLDPNFKGPGKRRGKKGRAVVFRRIAKRKFHKERSGNSYFSRNLILKEIGFNTYKDYLKSELWKKIRKKVLAREKNVCEICQCHGNQVHHSRYHKNDLTGKNLNFLHVLCGDCHEKIEFKNGEKVWMEEALSRQRQFKENEEQKTEIQKEYQSKYGFLDDEFNRMFSFN
jgi:hypothetical protein